MKMKKDIAVFLFDLTGIMAEPWLEAGYECWIVDTQHPAAYDSNGITTEGNLHRVNYDLSHSWLPPFDRNRIAFVAAFPPCDHVAVSGARWLKGKGLRKLQQSIGFFATSAEFCEWSGAPYLIENPLSTLSTYWRKPDYKCHPYYFTQHEPKDNYTKTTCLWVGGGFVMSERAQMEGLEKPDDRIHKCAPGPDRANKRSASPRGFAIANFLANGNELLAPQPHLIAGESYHL